MSERANEGGEFWVARDSDGKVYPFWSGYPPVRDNGEDGAHWWAYQDMLPPSDEEELPYEQTYHLPFDADGSPIRVKLVPVDTPAIARGEIDDGG